MIFLVIISLVLGFCLVALGFIVDSFAGPWVSALSVSLLAFFGGQRMMRGGSRDPVMIVLAGLTTVLPVWLVPLIDRSRGEYAGWLPVFILVTLALAFGLYLGWKREVKRKSRRRPLP